jgi:hypothetical protein
MNCKRLNKFFCVDNMRVSLFLARHCEERFKGEDNLILMGKHLFEIERRSNLPALTTHQRKSRKIASLVYFTNDLLNSKPFLNGGSQ